MKAVVTLGKYFGPKHPRKGQETGFIAKVADGRKVHTCRSNYGYWRAKIEKITATGGVLTGIVGVQRLALRRERRVINHYAEEQDKPIATATYYDYTAEVDGHPVPLEILAENDGLTVDDFKAWFAPIFAETDKKYPQFAGLASAVTIDFAIIHFTKRRY